LTRIVILSFKASMISSADIIFFCNNNESQYMFYLLHISLPISFIRKVYPKSSSSQASKIDIIMFYRLRVLWWGLHGLSLRVQSSLLLSWLECSRRHHLLVLYYSLCLPWHHRLSQLLTWVTC
jgi:hypothetical protein